MRRAAGGGRGGSDREAYFGGHLLVAARAAGPLTGWVLGPASTKGRWLADAFFCWRHDAPALPGTPADLPPAQRTGGGDVGYTGPVGPADATGAPRPTPYMGDRGFAGTHWPAHWANDDAAAVLTQRNYTGEHAPAARRQHSGGRQRIETVNTHLDTVCHLTFPGARTRQGRRARRAAQIAACNRGVWLNHRWHRPTCAFATLTPF